MFILPAPSAPLSLSSVDMLPSKSHGPRITTWSKNNPNGVIRSYTLFYSHDGVAPKEISGLGKDALNHIVDVLGGVMYQFNVRGVTIKPGPNAMKTVTTKEYGKLYFHVFEMTSFQKNKNKNKNDNNVSFTISFNIFYKFKKQTVAGHPK